MIKKINVQTNDILVNTVSNEGWIKFSSRV